MTSLAVRMAVLAGCALALTGCPVPIFEDPPFEEITPQFAVGSTSRLDVLLTLGEPTFVAAGEEAFAYLDSQLIMALVFAGGGPAGVAAGGLTTGRHHALVVEFDDAGVSEHVEVLTAPFVGGGGTDFNNGEYGERISSRKLCTVTGTCLYLRHGFVALDSSAEGDL